MNEMGYYLFMSKLRAFFGNSHIGISIATGISVIVLAYVSKRVLPQPISYLELAAPPFLMTVYEVVIAKKKDAWYCRTAYWIAAIFVATILVIVANAL
jgi:hypothetical protein